jgi:hypothetical protein
VRSEDALIRLAGQIDATLDSGLTGKEVLYDDQSWDHILKRNGVELPRSGYDLDAPDWTICCITGIGCGILDLTKQYANVLHNEDLHNKFDSLSKEYLRKVTNSDGIAAIDNIKGGPYHRMVGPAHDLTRFMEAIGQMMKGEFRSNVMGKEFISTVYGGRSQIPYVKIDSAADAAVVLILHLIGDFFSATSLPFPGRTRIAESEVRDVVKEVFDEYRNGGNLRPLVSEFLSNVTGAILIPIVLRLYRYVRVAIERRSMPSLSLKNDVKFHVLDRNAQTISFVISAGRAAFTSNPVALNYMNFVEIVRSGAAINRISKAEQEQLLKRIDAVSLRIAEL